MESPALFGPEGAVLRNQTSMTADPSALLILVPCESRAEATAGARSEGGAPAGSLLYCCARRVALNTAKTTGREIALFMCLMIPSGLFTTREILLRTWSRAGPSGKAGAGDGIRTRDIDLGKVALYQLSYSRALETIQFPAFWAACQ